MLKKGTEIFIISFFTMAGGGGIYSVSKVYF